MNWYLRLAGWAARILPQPIKKTIYRFQPMAVWLRRTLNRAAPQGQAEISIAAGVLQGFKMRLDLHSEKDYWLGTYEPDLQAAAVEFVRKGMVIYDVGANIGYISLMMARLCTPGGKVFSFEALPANLRRLRDNIALNQMGASIQVIPGAVVDTSRPVRFLAHSSTSMGKALGSAGRAEKYDQEITVAGMALDDFVYKGKNPAPDLIKMDIEGGEVLAIQGLQNLLKKTRPMLLVELHGAEAAESVWNALTKEGYEILAMKTGHARIQSLEQLGWKSYLIARYPL
jgi:FkbM family methyltransferase